MHLLLLVRHIEDIDDAFLIVLRGIHIERINHDEAAVSNELSVVTSSLLNVTVMFFWCWRSR